MLKRFILSYVCLGLLLVLSCAHYKEFSEIQRIDKRSYTKVLKDRDGNRVMEVAVLYIGRLPQAPLTISVPWDWKTQETDWYNIAFKNLTTSTIEFKEASVTWEKGPARTTITQEQIRERIGNHLIAPEKEVHRRNTGLISNLPHDICHFIYTLRCNTKEYSIDLPLAYYRD